MMTAKLVCPLLSWRHCSNILLDATSKIMSKGLDTMQFGLQLALEPVQEFNATEAVGEMAFSGAAARRSQRLYKRVVDDGLFLQSTLTEATLRCLLPSGQIACRPFEPREKKGD